MNSRYKVIRLKFHFLGGIFEIAVARKEYLSITAQFYYFNTVTIDTDFRHFAFYKCLDHNSCQNWTET